VAVAAIAITVIVVVVFFIESELSRHRTHVHGHSHAHAHGGLNELLPFLERNKQAQAKALKGKHANEAAAALIGSRFAEIRRRAYVRCIDNNLLKSKELRNKLQNESDDSALRLELINILGRKNPTDGVAALIDLIIDARTPPFYRMESTDKLVPVLNTIADKQNLKSPPEQAIELRGWWMEHGGKAQREDLIPLFPSVKENRN